MPNLSPLLLTSFIKDALSLGVGATESLDVFRAVGGAIRTQTFLDAYRAVGQLPLNAKGIAALSSTSPIPDQYITPGYENQSKKYIYQVALDVDGEGLRGDSPFGITFGSNQKASAAYIKKRAQELLDQRLQSYSINVNSVTITAVLQRQ